jgi:hypothetical protein
MKHSHNGNQDDTDEVQHEAADEALLLSIDLDYRLDLLFADLTLPTQGRVEIAVFTAQREGLNPESSADPVKRR